MGRFLVYFTLVAAIIYVLGFVYFMHQLPQTMAQPTTPTTQAVSVFTGSTGRIAAGFEILRSGFNGPLFVSGVHPTATLEDLTDSTTLTDAQKERITLDYSAQNTRDNVRSSNYWLAEKGLGSVTIVTAYYHLPRSLMLWQQHAPHIKAEGYPVFTGKASLFTLWREYNKYLAAALRLL